MKKLRRLIYILLILYALHPIKAKNTQKVLASSFLTDTRIESLEAFYKAHKSPLVGSSAVFISVADRYNLDWRLLPAISGAESTFGQHTPSCANYNIFGWTSLTSPCGFWRFESYDEAVRFVAKEITTKDRYASFRNTGKIRELSATYNKSNPTWIKNVNKFMKEVSKND